MLAMNPTGTHIVAGTDNGTVDCYDAEGNLNWIYYSNSGTGSGQAIQAVAVARYGTKIVAGSVDGKILLLDSAGRLLWTYNTGKEKISKAAIAADGSLAVAAGDDTLFAFFTDKRSTNRVTVSPQQSASPQQSVSPQESVVKKTLTVNMTEYAIIRTATQSPLEGMAGIAALLIVVIFISRRYR
jgi:outer membrane protein assembly factor BamB